MESEIDSLYMSLYRMFTFFSDITTDYRINPLKQSKICFKMRFRMKTPVDVSSQPLYSSFVIEEATPFAVISNIFVSLYHIHDCTM